MLYPAELRSRRGLYACKHSGSPAWLARRIGRPYARRRRSDGGGFRQDRAVGRVVAARGAAGRDGAFAAGCAWESDLAEGEAGRIARVLDADSLALDAGLRVRLAEVEAPAAAGYGTLSAQNRFALTLRTMSLKTPAGRAKRIASFVEMLERGETVHPQGRKKG